MSGRAGLGMLAALLVASCDDPSDRIPATPAEPARPVQAEARPARGAIDAHVHLTDGAASDLVGVLDDAGIDRAVIIAGPHLDPAMRGPRGEPLARYRDANEMILAAAAAHPGRLVPFVAVDLGATEVDYLAQLLDRGACGVKIYQGHQALHRRPLADPTHEPIFELLSRRRTPVLLHVNTVAYRDELTALLTRFPELEAVCAHLCGSRTDLDRLAGIQEQFPTLRVDTSHGAGPHGAAGFAHIEGQRARLRRMITAEPHRYLFGSDLVTTQFVPGWRQEWAIHLDANLGLLAAGTFRGWRPVTGQRATTLGEYQGLDLPGPVLARVLGDNARRWLASCEPDTRR